MFNLEANKDKIAALNEKGEQLHYSELVNFSQEFYSWIGRRTFIFILCTNTFSSLKGYVACMETGIVPLLLDAHMDKDLMHNLIQTYRPEYIWAPDSKQKDFEFERIHSDGSYSLFLTGFPEVELYKELALLLNTSGSTGASKLVRQSYRNIIANTESIVEYLKLTDEERPITTLPMQYTYGLSIINTHLYVGATILLTEYGILQKEFWNFFKNEKATSFGGVPYTYEMLKKLRIFRMDLPSLRTMTQAGGKLTPELHKEFAEFSQAHNINFIVMYGQTEATARMGYLPAEKSVEKAGSMGIAIPGGKLSIIDVNGKEITEPEISGELVYEGDNVTLGYATCPEDLAKGDERHERLETGDMAKRDADGFYYIVGRKKRFLKIFGNRVNLDEIDRLIKARFDNIECASTGVDDNLYVFIVEGQYQEAVRQFVIEKTGLNHVAIHVMVIDEIPKNDSGKVHYTDLEQYYKK